MRILHPKSFFGTTSFFTLLIFNVIAIVIIIKVESLSFWLSLLFLIVGNAWGYGIAVSGHYNFAFDDKYLTIENSLNPFFHRNYTLSVVKKIEMKYLSGTGHAIVIYYEGKKDVYACDIQKENMVEFVKCMNEQLLHKVVKK